MQKQTIEQRSQAERVFLREQRKADAPKAMQDYRAAQQSVIERTQRLRAERLARESAQ